MIETLVIVGYVIGYIVSVLAMGPVIADRDRRLVDTEGWVYAAILMIFWPIIIVIVTPLYLVVRTVKWLNAWVIKISDRMNRD